MLAELVGNVSGLVIAVNKVDLLQPPEDRPRLLQRLHGRLRATLQDTRFKDALMVDVSANPEALQGIDDLIAALLQHVATHTPHRDHSGPFVFAIDHCFPIQGQGTVMTGTILSGQISTNQVSTAAVC